MAASGGLLTREIDLASFKDALGRFWAWERDQIRSMLPPAALAWLLGRGTREAVVRAGESLLALPETAGAAAARVSGEEVAASSLDSALDRRGLARKALAIVLEMPPGAFLTRQFDVPGAALAQLPQLLRGEVERRTPFRNEDVLIGHLVSPADKKGKARVRMALLRRDLVATALAPSGLVFGDLTVIRAERAPDPPDAEAWTPSIAVNRAADPDRGFARVCLALTVSAALLLAAGLGATFWRQSAEADDLDARIGDASARAARVRQVADRARQESRLLTDLRALRAATPPLTELWEEISAIIPDSAFLTDFHLSEPRPGERSVDLTGFAQSAVGLPLLFGRSRFFSEAALTAPITVDPAQKRESFALRLKIRTAAGAAADRPANLRETPR
jgi:general secretion pathway protein L